MSKTESVLAAAGKSFRRHGMSHRVKNMIMSPIKEMMLLAGDMQNPLTLAQGIPAENPAPHILQAMHEALDGPVAAKYSVLNGLPELRQAIADRYKTKYNVSLDPKEEISITAGCMQACITAILSVVDSGDEVIIIAPDFASHSQQIRAAGGVPVYVNTNPEDGWSLDIKEVEKAITPGTKAIMITNPVNPTGTVFTKEELEQLSQLAAENDLYIFADETYDFLTYDNTPFTSLIEMENIRSNLILLGSFSKEYCMTGYRIGWVIAPADVMNQILKVHDAAIVCAPVISQMGALAALQGPQDCVANLKQKMQERRDLMCERIDRMPHLFTYYKKPKGAYYLMTKIQFPHENSVEAALRIQKDTEVTIVPGIGFGPIGEGHLRFSFGGGSSKGPKGFDLINEAFDRLEDWGKQFK